MSSADYSSPQTQPSITDLLTPVENNVDDELDDSIFESEAHARKRRWRVSLFWYTFRLLVLLLGVTTLLGYWLLKVLDNEPRVRENTRQIVSIVTLTRMALLYPNPEHPLPPVETLMPDRGMHLIPHASDDRIVPLPDGNEREVLVSMLRSELGSDIGVASSVNGRPGLWVGFDVDRHHWWLWFDDAHLEQGVGRGVLLLWLGAMALLLPIGAALFARLINGPLNALAQAATQVRGGDYTKTHLDENVPQTEVYQVNARFNSMAQQLARNEQDRAQMLAGISHDLRTPLARLRLEVEMGVPDEQVRERMSSDIEQVGTILNKFLDYARSSPIQLYPVNLYRLIHRCTRHFVRREDMTINVDVPENVNVMADEVELGRVIYNLLENANRYGRTPETGFTKVRIAATVKDGWVKLRVRDYGAGVPEKQIPYLPRPFYRGDGSRRNAAGTGLGLTIASRAINAMNGKFKIVNASSGGLQVLIRLQSTDIPTAQADAANQDWQSPS